MLDAGHVRVHAARRATVAPRRRLLPRFRARAQPAMERIQFALEKQLKGAYDVASVKLSEESEELQRCKRQREDVGVQLYQMQQQLAKLQMNLEKVHENGALISQVRHHACGRKREGECRPPRRARAHVVSPPGGLIGTSMRPRRCARLQSRT